MDIGAFPAGDGHAVSYPASLAQTRFWLLDALDPGTPSLNVAVRWTLLGPVTHAAAEAAMRRVIARHEVLRTALPAVDGSPLQLVRPMPPFRLGHHDLSALPPAERAAEADRLGEAEARTPFALERPPLLRATLVTLGPCTARLLLTMHHAVCDGWSVGVVADEFMAALRGGPPLPELALQYGDFAEWQQAWLASPALDTARAYWTETLRDLPYVMVPPDRPGEQRGPGAIASILLPRALTDAAAATAARHGCTAFTVALAALGRVLQARTGADDIAVGTQVAGRTEIELEGMVGAFINTLVLRLDLSGAPDWDGCVSRAAAVVDGALAHHAMPFELLIRALNPPRERRRSPLFSVNFIFQRSFVSPTAAGGITLVDMPSHSAGALYDLNFFMVERPDGWRASCEYDAALFDAASVTAMLSQWRTALEGRPVAAPAAADAVLDQLGAIWRDVLGVAAVAPEEGFFELGGHSLLAARMLARVEAAFGHRVGMDALFADGTLGGLAARLRPEDASTKVFAAVGEAADWRRLGEALGQDIATATEPGTVPGGGSVTLLARGAGGPTALALACALRDQGRAVTLVLVDAAAPRPERFFRRPARARPPFDGRTLLFRRPSNGADPAAGWARHLRGELDLIPLATAPWETTVAERLTQ